jgi:hypothetical protein
MLPQRPLRFQIFTCQFMVPVGSESYMEVEIIPIIVQNIDQALPLIWKLHWRYLVENLGTGTIRSSLYCDVNDKGFIIPKMTPDIRSKLKFKELGVSIWGTQPYVSPEIRTVIPI